jgi:hypothetical protein
MVKNLSISTFSCFLGRKCYLEGKIQNFNPIRKFGMNFLDPLFGKTS